MCDILKNCTSIEDIRDKDVSLGIARLRAIAWVKQLGECEHNGAIKEALEDDLNEAIEVHDANNNPNINIRDAANIVNTLMELLGLEVGHVDEEGAISAIIDTDQGVLLTHSNTFVQSIARTRLGKAESEASRDFCAAWEESTEGPIKLISDLISQVEVGGRPIVICLCFSSNGGGSSWTPRTTESSYSSEIHLAKHMKKMPAIVA